MEQTPAETMQDMPRPLATAVTNFVVALAIEAGAAVDAGKPPPGDPLDDTGHRYGLQVQGEPVLLEYTVHPEGPALGGRRRGSARVWTGATVPGKGAGMDDDDTPGQDSPNTEHLVALYLETLQVRMDPAEYTVLTEALRGFQHVMETGGEGGFDIDDEEAFTPEVRKELMTVLAILGTGRMDQRVVELPGTGGARGWVVVDAAVADDPERLAELGRRLQEWERDRQATDAVLDGIEEATRDQDGP